MDLLNTSLLLGIKGYIHPLELEKLAEFALNKDVLEVGSFCGLSAWAMAIGAKSLQCVDTFRADGGGQTQMSELTTLDAFLQATYRYSHVKHFIGTSAEAINHVEGEFDVVFIDAMHLYEDVKGDIDRWWPRLRPGGVMIFHDYGNDGQMGVRQAVDERFQMRHVLVARQVATMTWVYKE